jgi:LuxR family maltose regulon positive regulatory protein
VLDTLISTKFHNPLTAGRLTQRPRLDARLDESLQAGCRLVLVTAPAGFGKSTLVSAWVQKQSIRFAWVSLDSGDNEPRQFLSYLVGALQKIEGSFGASLINRIMTADTADSEAVYADVVTHLVNEITALVDPFILVLDDCHLVKNLAVARLLTFLIEHQPPQMHLILLTREDLPLPIPRLRVRRQVIEIRQADLQFSPVEAEDFLREGMGISGLTSRDILALEQRTEGWIAGLQLAALSMKYDPDPARFIETFTGSDRYILDYLLEEVFTHQPEKLKNFLLATSILERFSAPLCDTVLEEMQGHPVEQNESSLELLAAVEHANLFLIPLDSQRVWFRYHHLFADLLRHALAYSYPKKISSLHLRASQWLEANDFILESVTHGFQTGDWQYAAELVERHAWHEVTHSRVATTSEWCRTFPEKIISNHPALCIFHAWALIIGFKKSDFSAAYVRLEQAEAALAGIDPQTRASLVPGAPPVLLHTWVRGQITLLRSFLLMTVPRKQANPQALIEFGQLAYDQLPVEDIPARSAGLLDICYAIQANSDADAAEEKFKHTIRLALSGSNYFGAMVGEYHRAHDMLAKGKLYEVISFCNATRKTYEAHFEHPRQELPAIALLDQATGCALLELNRLVDAEQYLQKGLEVGQWMPREELPGYLALARLCEVKGDEQGMAESLRRLDMRWPDITYCTQAMRTVYNLRLRPDDLTARSAAETWAASQVPEIGPGIVIPGIGPAWNDEADHAVYTAWAQVQIMLGKPDEALEVIAPMLEVALKHSLIHRVIELRLLEAQAYYVQNKKDRAWEALKPALDYAKSEGYLRLIDQGPVLVRLFREVSNQGIESQFIHRILKAGIPETEQSASNQNLTGMHKVDPGWLIEQLSSRELEVLTLMAQGLSNSEIAARLFLSTNTLKSHTQNIFGKLDVHSRVQAVNKAREFGMI